MIEGLRAEFPGATRWVARLAKPSIARESVGWAFLSALGAAFILEAIVRLALMAIYPALFPPTEPHPEWLTPSVIASVAGGVVAGAIARRAGGIPAVAAYVAYELAILLAAFPGRVLFCARSGALVQGLPGFSGCDFASLLTAHWPIWLALAVGVIAAPLVRTAAGEGNRLLRGAGAVVLITSVLGSTVGLLVALSETGGNPNATLLNVLFLVIQIVAGLAAGLLLARSPLAGAVLVALLIVAPALAYTLPLALRGGFPSEPVEFTLAQWSGVLIPLVGAAMLLASRAYVRSRGTIS